MKKRTVGVFSPYLDAPFERPFLRGMQSAADELGVRIVVFVGGQMKGDNPDERRFNRCYELASEKSIDGLIIPTTFMARLLPAQEQKGFFERFSTVPTISVFEKVDGFRGITWDNRAALRRSMDHLISAHGCQRIALAVDRMCGWNLLEEYRAVCSAWHLPADENLFISGIGSYEYDGKEVVEELIHRRGVQPDGLIVTSAMAAAGAGRRLRELGINVPTHLKLACFANDEFSWPVTSAVEPLPELARRALQLVIDIIDGHNVPDWTVVPYERALLVNSSCGCGAGRRFRDESERTSCDHVAEQAVDIALSYGVKLTDSREVFKSLYSGLEKALLSSNPASLEPALRVMGEQLLEIRRTPLILSPILLFFAHRIRSATRIAISDSVIEEICARAVQFLVSEIFLSEKDHDYLDYSVLNRSLHTSLLRISTCTRVDDLLKPLETLIATLDMAYLSLSWYDDENQERAREIVTFGPNRPLERVDIPFESLELLPGGMQKIEVEGHCAVHPLFSEANIGFMVMPFNVEQMHHYRPIRERIASSLTTAILFRKIEMHVDSLAEANHKLREENDQRSRLQEALIQSQKMEAIGRVAGGVAHDFNNLLSMIIGNAGFLLKISQDQAVTQRAQAVTDAANVAAHLTRQLLTFSRKQTFNLQLIDLRDSVRETLPLVKSALGGRCRLEINLSNDALPIIADRTQIEQVIINLAVNARDAMPEGGSLNIEGRSCRRRDLIEAEAEAIATGTVIVLSFRDTGCGMDAGVQQRIFEPFFTTKGPEKGMGMGLATVYGIVKQCRGGINVVSGPGEGTTFTLFFPCAQESTRASTLDTENRRLSVLLVDDEHSLRMLTAEYLAQEGHTVIEAADAKEAEIVAQNHQGRFDLIIADIDAAHAGHPLIAGIRQRYPDAKAILLSRAHLQSEQASHDTLLLRKPFTADLLLSAVHEVLSTTTTNQGPN